MDEKNAQIANHITISNFIALWFDVYTSVNYDGGLFRFSYDSV